MGRQMRSRACNGDKGEERRRSQAVYSYLTDYGRSGHSSDGFRANPMIAVDALVHLEPSEYNISSAASRKGGTCCEGTDRLAGTDWYTRWLSHCCTAVVSNVQTATDGD